VKVLQVKLDTEPNAALKQALKKGYRTEWMYNNYSFDVHIQVDHPWEIFSRMYWENNHFNQRRSRYIPTEDTFIMDLRLSEAIDYIYNCTPARLQNEIPSNITTVESIRQLVADFLMDDTLGRQEYYHDAFKALTMMSFEKKPGFDTKPIEMIRQHVPNGIVMHVVQRSDPTDPKWINGLYTFNCFNKKQLTELLSLLSMYLSTYIIETYKDKEGYYDIGVYFGMPVVDYDEDGEEGIDLTRPIFYEKFDQIYHHSYDWMNQK
jgi:hypothetical protein